MAVSQLEKLKDYYRRGNLKIYDVDSARDSAKTPEELDAINSWYSKIQADESFQKNLPRTFFNWAQADRKIARERQSQLDRENRADREDARRRLREQESRERRRQITADRERDRALDYMNDIMARREEQIADLKASPSTAMAAAQMAYDKQAQNMAGVASLSGGRGFSRTGEQVYGDAMSAADANLLNATGISVLQEKLNRDATERAAFKPATRYSSRKSRYS